MTNPDRRQAQRSAMGVGVLVGAASAIIVVTAVATLVTVLLVTARVEGHEGGRSRSPDGDRFVVDLDHILPWLVFVGVAAVILLAGVAWMAAHRAVGPLSEALRMRRSFVSDASHELRTPLTALSARIQILQRRHERGQPIDATIAALRRDAATLDDVLTDMLLTAEGDSSVRERAEVSACISAAVETVRPLADDGAVSVSSRIEGDPVARMPTVTLTRLCVALLDNAVQHAPAGSQVTARAVRTNGTVEIRVADGGKGIAAADTGGEVVGDDGCAADGVDGHTGARIDDVASALGEAGCRNPAITHLKRGHDCTRAIGIGDADMPCPVRFGSGEQAKITTGVDAGGGHIRALQQRCEVSPSGMIDTPALDQPGRVEPAAPPGREHPVRRAGRLRAQGRHGRHSRVGVGERQFAPAKPAHVGIVTVGREHALDVAQFGEAFLCCQRDRVTVASTPDDVNADGRAHQVLHPGPAGELSHSHCSAWSIADCSERV